MAYQPPTIVASGMTFAAFQAAGPSGHLELLLSKQIPTAAPTVAPTVTATGGGSSGGLLAAGTYYVVFTESSGLGETTPSPVSTQVTVAPGNIPEVTVFPALQTGNTYRNVYLGAVNGPSTGPFALYGDGVTTATFTFPTAVVTNSYGAVTPPATNQTGLEFTDATGNVQDKTISLIRAIKDGNMEDIYSYHAANVRVFNQGEPIPFNAVMTKMQRFHVVVAILNQLALEEGVLVDANPGTLKNTVTGIGGSQVRRSWP